MKDITKKIKKNIQKRKTEVAKLKSAPKVEPQMKPEVPEPVKKVSNTIIDAPPVSSDKFTKVVKVPDVVDSGKFNDKVRPISDA